MKRKLLLATLFGFALVGAACGNDETLEADAGADFTISVGEAPEFDACDSSGDVANYAWQILEAPADMADDAGKFLRETSGDCSFVLESSMVVADVGQWVIELTVSDSGGDTAVDQVTVTVS